MNDEIKQEPRNDEQAAAAEPEGPAIAQRIVITMFADHQVRVTGPLQDQVLMLGLLEVAKHACIEHVRQLAANRAQVQVASPTLFGRLKQLAPLRKGH